VWHGGASPIHQRGPQAFHRRSMPNGRCPTSDAQRAAYVAAAEYVSAVLTSTLEGVYSIVTLSSGILTTSLVMLRGVFNKLTAYVGVATGVLGVVSVAGPLISSALRATIIVASILTTLWILLTGYRLYRLA
jgi:hypothetical protein